MSLNAAGRQRKDEEGEPASGPDAGSPGAALPAKTTVLLSSISSRLFSADRIVAICVLSRTLGGGVIGALNRNAAPVYSASVAARCVVSSRPPTNTK